MKIRTKITAVFLLLDALFLFSACGGEAENAPAQSKNEPAVAIESNLPPELPEPLPKVPNLQAELLDGRSKTTASPLGSFDFRNFTYKLPRGWQNAEGEITLENGKSPVSLDEEERKIGAGFVTTKFVDATGDGLDEAFVIIKLETGGSAIPQIVYVFEWKNNEPDLIWFFRTGDRADGGLKDIRAENGMLVIEIFGQDRYILGEVETAKITNDEEQICCPTHFTRSVYKWNGSIFRIEGKRLTFLTADKNAPPIENMIEESEKTEKQNSGKK